MTRNRSDRMARSMSARGLTAAASLRLGMLGVLGFGLGAVAALGSFGCRRTSPGSGAPVAESAPAPARPVLGEVTLRDATPPGATPPAAIDFDGLQAQLRSQVVASGLFTGGAADAGDEVGVVRVRADVSLDGAEVEDKGVARAAVRIRFETRPSDAPGAIDEELAGQGEQVYPIPKGRKKVDQRPLFSRLALRVAGDLIDGFAAREKLRTAPVSAIQVALRADGGELQEQAIRIAGERKLRDEVPVLLELLDNPNESVRDAALGALIQIGDRRAVTALAKSRSLHDRREMRKIIDAIATLGGDEALDYLSFVAASHDDEEIRALAAAAKQRLERRQRGSGAP
jgi:hypothetical protein